MKNKALLKRSIINLVLFLIFLGTSVFTGCDNPGYVNYDGTYVSESDSDDNSFEMRMVIDESQVTGEIIIFPGRVFYLSGQVNKSGTLFLKGEYKNYGNIMSLTGSISDEYASGKWKINTLMRAGGAWHAKKIETFESGDLNEFPWETEGDGEWMVTDSEPFEGYSAAQSPVLGDGQSATLEIIRECEAGWIKFARKVDSEPNFDYLYFYIDDELRGAWSGNIDYQQSGNIGYTVSGNIGYTVSGGTWYTQSGSVGYTVSAGTHEFKWEYRKDNASAVGEDSAWIDNVQFPEMPREE